MRARVALARQRQARRGPVLNAELDNREIGRSCPLDADGRRLLEAAHERLGLSARAHVRILRVARTIADLAGDRRTTTSHLAEALQYRSQEATEWPLAEPAATPSC